MAADRLKGIAQGARGTSVRGVLTFLLPAVFALAVTGFVGAYSVTEPEGIRVDVVGGGNIDNLKGALSESFGDDAFEIGTADSRGEAFARLSKGEIHALLLVGPEQWQLQYAGTNGVILNNFLQFVFRPPSGITYDTVDALELDDDDPGGFAIPMTVLAAVVAGAVIAIVPAAARRSPGGEIGRAALASVVAGLATGLLVSSVYGAIPGGPAGTGALVAAACLATALVVAGARRLAGGAGVAVAVLVVVVIGMIGSASFLDEVYLREPLRSVGAFLPPGAAADAVRGEAYFGGEGTLVSVSVLAAWALIGAGLVVLGARTRPAVEDGDGLGDDADARAGTGTGADDQ